MSVQNIQNKERIAALVVGGSGHGKSEFILSFINKEDREKIHASGEGQTTRTSMVYNISCEKKNPLHIQIELKSKEKFVQERMSVLDGFMDDIPTTERKRNYMQSSLIRDKAFFNVFEFGNEIANHVIEIYNYIFNERFFSSIEKIEKDDVESYVVSQVIWKELKQAVRKKETNINITDEQKNIKIDICFKEFFEYVYDCCKNNILNEYSVEELENIANKPTHVIEKFLKTVEGELSYSSLVENVIINTHIASYYERIFQKLNISDIVFVDTYGLNHAETAGSEIVKKRYQQLLGREYTDIKTVFYLRNVNNTESPTDLKQNIPLLFSVAPTVVPYIIFTKVDELERNFTDSKAYKIIDDLKDEIGIKLEENKVSEELINNRLCIMLDNRIGYCSYIGKSKKYEKYKQENIVGVTKIFSAIRYKKHLGTNLIPIHKMNLHSLQDVLNLKYIFSDEQDLNFNHIYYPSRTKGALSSRLQGGILGFNGSTTMTTYWSDIVRHMFNNRFQNIVELYKWGEYLESQNIKTTLSELFLILSDSIYKCVNIPDKNFFDCIGIEPCVNCLEKKNCIKEILFNEKSKLIKSKYSPVGDWLTEVYKFSCISEDGKQSIQAIINKHFVIDFIEQCRQHNAIVIAQQVSNEITQEDLDKELNDYYLRFDKNINSEEKIQFEQMVNSYIE